MNNKIEQIIKMNWRICFQSSGGRRRMKSNVTKG